MAVLLSHKLILFISVTFALSAAHGLCVEDSAMFHLNSRGSSDEDCSKSNDAVPDEKQRSLSSEELKDWASKNIVKMSIPMVNKIANSVANLPLRFGRSFQEVRSIKPVANLPLRFGRAFEERISKSIPNLPQRMLDLNNDANDDGKDVMTNQKTCNQYSI
ncbi:pro-FMRFamide-related neuropeptide VF [Rhinatrema bivittatum]|uniref:pro-FMRFamide-related neuropeptide VF n=1 Tax=Rhinatrema bivittatum TaxID=194408 RepID=UPI00112BA4B2|nr:pro-FMRFamide-related neuropeptide VF [Rhinatrema bivittatum]